MRFVAYGLLFLVASAAGFASGLGGMAERAASKIEHRLERRLGIELAVDSADWTLGGDVTLKGVSVRSKGAPKAEPALFQASEIRVDGGFNIFRARARLNRVEIDGGALSLIRRSDGSSNIDSVLAEVKRLTSKRGGGGRSGGGINLLERHIPEVVLKDAAFSLDLGRKSIGPVTMPLRLEGGAFNLKNTAVVKEADNVTLSGGFSRTTLEGGQGLEISAKVSRADGPERFSLKFTEPPKLRVGQRHLAVGGLSWARGGVLSINEISLSSPRGKRPSKAPAAISIQSIRLVPEDGLELQSLMADGGASRRSLRSLVKRLGRVEVIRPAFVFERRGNAHSFSDLAEAFSLFKARRDPSVGLVFGETVQAARAAAVRLTGPRKKAGQKLRRALIGAFESVRRLVGRVAPKLRQAVGANPFKHLRIREGHFAWRQKAPKKVKSWEHRFENFNIDLKRTGRVHELQMDFMMPRVSLGKNMLQARFDQRTGDIQVDLEAQRLNLYPYRHVFPEKLPVSKNTVLQQTDLTLVWSPSRQVAQVSGTLGGENLGLFIPAVARQPMTDIDLSVKFEAAANLAEGSIALDMKRLRLGKVNSVFRGEFKHLQTAPKLSWVYRLHRSRCQDVLEALPTAFVSQLKGMKLAGTIGWQLEVSLDTRDIDSLTYRSNPALTGFKILKMSKKVPLDTVRGTFQYDFVDVDGTVRSFPLGPEAKGWASLGAISPFVVKAITTTEDGAFFRHKGFSTLAIRNSILTNLKRGGFYRGASTVSQQLVKNIFLSREKTLSRKTQEMFITWQLEKVLTKRRIMELYLNAIELGPGIYGIRKAARRYFGKRPSQLTLLESVFIVSLIPSPRRYYRQYLRGEVTAGWSRHLKWIIGVMLSRGKISQADYNSAIPFSPLFRGRKRPPSPTLPELDSPEDEPPPHPPW